VVPLPAPDMGPNRLLAEHIARKGRLPLNDALQWNGPAAPQEVASSAEVSHLEQVLALRSDSALPAGPLLLVSTQERSRWCASLAATLLRENGAHSVLLLVLHLRP
jgi:ATP-dependent DNA helicase RecQ